MTCLSVVGSQTAVGGFVTQPSDPAGVPFLVYFSDNGLPGHAIDGISPCSISGPDEALPAPEFSFVCPAAQSPLGYYPLTSGELIVR